MVDELGAFVEELLLVFVELLVGAFVLELELVQWFWKIWREMRRKSAIWLNFTRNPASSTFKVILGMIGCPYCFAKQDVRESGEG